MDRGRPGPGLLANILVEKFVDSLQAGVLERGLKLPTLDTLVVLAKALGVPVSELVRARDVELCEHSTARRSTRCIPPPDIADVAARVEKRMCRWLRRRGLLDERAAEDRSNEAPELSPLEACMQLSLFGSTYVRLAGDGAPAPLAREEARFRAAGKGPWVAEVSGFNVHGGVTCARATAKALPRCATRARAQDSAWSA